MATAFAYPGCLATGIFVLETKEHPAFLQNISGYVFFFATSL